MKSRLIIFVGLAFVLLAFCPSAVKCQQADKMGVLPGGILELSLRAGGRLEITGWDRPLASVECSYDEEDDPYRVKVTKTKTGLKIESDHERGRVEDLNGLRIRVMLPKQFHIEVDSVGGDLSLENMEGSFNGKNGGGDMEFRHVRGRAGLLTMGGDIRVIDSDLDGSLKTMGGEVLFRNVTGDVEGGSKGGEIRYDNVQGRDGRYRAPGRLPDLGMTAKTVALWTTGRGIEVADAPEGAIVQTMGGRIRISGACRFVNAKTMGGDINIRVRDGWVNAVTMDGDIDVIVKNGLGDGQGGISLKSVSGDINLTVPDGLSLSFDLKITYTKNSNRDYRIASDFAVKEEATKEWEYDKQHNDHQGYKYIYGIGSIAGGKIRVKIETVNGSITIRRGR